MQKREYVSEMTLPMLTICKKGYNVRNEEGKIVNVSTSDAASLLMAFCASYSSFTVLS